MSDYLMQARDSVAGTMHFWTAASPDWGGAGFSGPNSAVASTIAVVSTPAPGSGGVTFLPYRLERAIYTGDNLDLGASGFAVRNAHSMFVSPDETKLFILPGNGGFASDRKVHQFTLSTPGDLDTATLDGTFSVNAEDTDPQCITFNAAGTRMYMTGQTGDAVYQYNLGTAWEIVADPPTYAGSQSVSAQTAAPDGILLSPDGTTMLVAGGSVVYQYTLSTPDEVISGSMSYASLSATSTTGEGLCWGPSPRGVPGGRLFYTNGTVIAARILATPYSLSGSSADPTPTFNSPEQGNVYDVKFVSGGNRMWLVGPDMLYEYHTVAAVPAA